MAVSFVQDVEGMMSISTEAAEARASLSDERELLRTFEVIDQNNNLAQLLGDFGE